MFRMIPGAFINNLLDKLDIVELIGQYVPLKKQGANFTGLCPFHNEKTASFTVSPTKQFYHCFGCGAHGSVIGFMMQYLGQSFQDAVHDLASRLGLTLPSSELKEAIYEKKRCKENGTLSTDSACHTRLISKDRAGDVFLSHESSTDSLGQRSLFELLTIVMRFYKSQLRESREAILFLKKRGISGETAAKFKLGYAPSGWRNLSAVVDDYGANDLSEAGLVILRSESNEGKGNKIYDRFRNRIIFPISNSRGQIVAFGGRSIGGDHPKYLNSPETPIFTKGKELYALFEARRSIKDKGYVIVVEGYMDVLTLVQAGFGNTVATLGTACTSEHIQKLIRQTDKVIFCFDGDLAGRKAAHRALIASLPFALDTREFGFIFLPDADDPDSFVQDKGAKFFQEKIDQVTPLSSFLIQHAIEDKNIDTPEGRAAALFCAKPMLRSLPDQSLRVQIINILAERLKFDVREVVKLCQIGEGKVLKTKRSPLILAKKPVPGIEHRALCILLMFPHFAYDLSKEDRETLLFCTEQPALFKEVLSQIFSVGGAINFRSFSTCLRQSIYSAAFEECFMDILKFPENVRDLFSSEREVGLECLPSDLEKSSRVELHSALARLRYDACCKKLKQLSEVSNMSKEELVEFSKLSKLSFDLKKSILLN